MKQVLIFGLLSLVVGCTSFHSTQKFSFVDDNGLVLKAEYGLAAKPYHYKMISPMNGVEVDCTDTKMVKVTLPPPNNETIVCYICQNLLGKGTMYGTRDNKWKYATTGLYCRLYLWIPQLGDYQHVYSGTVFGNTEDSL